MSGLPQSIQKVYTYKAPVLDPDIPVNQYIAIDLSRDNPKLKEIDLTDPVECQRYIRGQMPPGKKRVAYGGYLERRTLYKNAPHFKTVNAQPRDIHLGIDFWTEAGTSVHVPVEGVVHSFNNNQGMGNYGPTIIIEHKKGGLHFYTLYGHLNTISLEHLQPGSYLNCGAALGKIGETSENGGYAPHLHFQLILDIGDYLGDYPGVAASDTLSMYKSNCPDPNYLLQLASN